MEQLFPGVKKVFGFGCMRLPMKDGEVDLEEFSQMTELFLQKGFNYFDTAHGYLDGRSERAIREVLTSRHKREEYILTNKLTSGFFEKEADIRPFFENQLRWCGVDYFDFYLMHAQSASNYDKYRQCHAYETAFALKKEGKVRHVGLSFHDKPEMLDRILTDFPEVEIVQIQFNYLDYADSSVESKAVYEVARKHGKPVIVMEPVKGGSLVNIPQEAQKIYDDLNAEMGTHYSNASYAIRFAAGFPGMRMVLSGMSNMQQLEDNLSFMENFEPLSSREQEAVTGVMRVFGSLDMIPCTACHYCVEENHCPKHLRIPDLFACLNKKRIFNNWNMDYYYNNVLTVNDGKASDCIGCGGCERVCPQHLEIRKLLGEVAAEFEKSRDAAD